MGVNQLIRQGSETLKESDLIIVFNEKDKALMVKEGLDENKIEVIPYGISRLQLISLNKISSDIPQSKKIAFIGTFDFRKGGADFLKIVKDIVKELPDIQFKLLGTKGMYQTKNEVLASFPKRLRKYIYVIPEFYSEES